MMKEMHLREYDDNMLDEAKAVFLYCCPDCLAYMNSIGWATWAIWTAISKYSLTTELLFRYISFFFIFLSEG